METQMCYTKFVSWTMRVTISKRVERTLGIEGSISAQYNEKSFYVARKTWQAKNNLLHSFMRTD